MKPAFRTLGLAALAAGAFALSACESQAEKEVDAQAEAIGEAADAQADILESLAPTASNGAEMKRNAEIIREKGEQTEEHLKAEADHLDDVPEK